MTAVIAAAVLPATAYGTAAQGPASPGGAEYVAMGDSFAAGAGQSPIEDTDAGRRCQRFVNNYPHVLAAEEGWTLNDVTCGGASVYPEAGYSSGGFYTPIDSNPAMLDAVGPDTKYVTFQLGGNDSRLPTLLIKCVQAGVAGENPVLGHACQDRDQAAAPSDRIDFEQAKKHVDEALKAIREKAPQAQVVVVGYPPILPPNGCAYNPLPIPGAAGIGPVSNADQRYYIGEFNELTETLKAVAEENGVTFADFSTEFQGHDACKSANARWVEGVLADVPVIDNGREIPPPPFSLAPGSDYMNWLTEYAAQRQPLWASAHPNKAGHEAIGQGLAEYFR
ncbi:SGNH/GDSL hydrolase family protein [Streptomyces sp. PsTaAH-124]|uniref:SGNH/GDSL hydrolase family protein n=1 Tax=Streptomyces sp. PsTaAH-124 TaxID=1157638 RepID=UPI00036F713B|nr:SGNH/GDSL hydrolase family protein [Streptomyces sp. PsTaAH-124]